MSKKGRAKNLKEPIQVYLAPEDRSLLDQAAKASGLSRAEVLRRGIRAVSGELIGDEHPALKFMREMQAWDWHVADAPKDPEAFHEWVEDELEKGILDNHETGNK